MKHMADISHIRDLNGATDESDQKVRSADIPPGVQIFTAHGSLFFGAAHKWIETIRVIGKPPRVLILDMSDVLHMDASGLHVLEQVGGECKARGTLFRISGMHSQPLLILQRAQFVKRLGEEIFVSSLPEALAAARLEASAS
jgi:SulP family sulfate permease